MTAPSLRRLSAFLVAALAAALLPAVITGGSAAAAPRDPLFAPVSGFDANPGAAKARVAPRRFEAFRIDLAGVGARLAAAPSAGAVRRGAAPLTFAVPAPSGRLESFLIHRTSVMERALAARHPEIRTFAGTGVDDPTTTIRLDLTPMGFHASVRGPGGSRSWYVDPAYDRPGTTTHLSYRRSALPAPEQPLVERFLGDDHADENDVDDQILAAEPTAAGEVVQRRTYRLALVTDPSYATYFGTENVLAEKVTLMNRVNQVYNDDLAIRMLLVDGTEKLNLDTVQKATGANGPCGISACYTPSQIASCGGSTLTRTEWVLGQLIGAQNFDVGHIGLGVNGGGIAGLGVVGEQYKADGCTGLPKPQGDFYAVDYVAHELGHQFAGNHTFNGTQGNCSLTNRNDDTSVEPGSGSSVMAYAGICARDNLQPHSDPYFSQRSIDEITAHVTAEPNVYNERQTITLMGWDAPEDSITLTFPGRDPVTITKGTDWTYVQVQNKINTLTGTSPRMAGYDQGGPYLNDGGVQLTWGLASQADGEDVPTIGIGGTSGVTAYVGVQVQGGEGTNQGVAEATGNHAPGVTAPADRSIPLRTPFTLTATGSDTDPGTELTYLWEQNDNGGAGPTGGTALMSNTKANGPLFRVFGTAAQVTPEGTLESPSPGINLADGSPSRTFPDLDQVLAGNTNAATGTCPDPPADAAAPVPQETVDCYSEFLPTSSYGSALHFRVTARDGFTEGGGTAYDDVTLTVAKTAGPFLVTAPNSGEPAEGGGEQVVTWAVNGTDAAALAPTVRILLSTDGGQTYPHVLVDETPNDGSQAVTWPMIGTDQARLRIEAVGNYFFDVNDAPFTIETPLTVTGADPQTLQYSDDFAEPVTLTASSDDVDGDLITASVAGVEGLSVTRGATSADGVRPGTAEFTVAGPVSDAPGELLAAVTVSEDVADGNSVERTFPVTVEAEDAAVAWTGDTEVVTEDDSAPVLLETEVTDPDDGSRGDVTEASVRFVDRDTDEVLCTAPVTGGPLTGTAGCMATLDRPDETTTYTIGTVVGGSYARDTAADDTTVVVRTEEPDTEAPDTEITDGPDERGFVLGRKVRLGFSGSEDTRSYECSLDRREVPCADGRVTLRKVTSGKHVFRVAARDEAGNLDPTPAVRRFAAPFNDRQLDRRGEWKRKDAGSAYRGTFLRARDKGSRVSLRLHRARSVALVVGEGPRYGKVAVYFRGERIGTVSLAAPEKRGKVLVTVATFEEPTSGRLRVETLGGRTVRIEGLGVA